MNVPMLALRREHAAIEGDLARMWAETLAGMRLLNGPQGRAFEAEIAAYTGAPAAVGVASGTDALTLGLLAAGVGPGDEVILPANAFIADLEAVRLAGAAPVLVDIAAGGYGPDLAAMESAIGPRARALLVVHLYGEPVEIEPLVELAARRNLVLVEDASHAHGARVAGRHVGTFGSVGASSAGVVKNLGAYGDAGFLITSDPAIAREARVLRSHGQSAKNRHDRYGFNSRLDELQAAVLRVKLPLLESRNARRREYAEFYSEALGPFCLRVPIHRRDREHAFHQYVVEVEERDALRAALAGDGIETGIHYPVPLHRQPAWLEAYSACGPFPRAEAAAERILSLPVVPDLTWDEIRYVADRVRHHLATGKVGQRSP